MFSRNKTVDINDKIAVSIFSALVEVKVINVLCSGEI